MAGKLTGMLLDLDESVLLDAVSGSDVLDSLLDQAYGDLCEYAAKSFQALGRGFLARRRGRRSRQEAACAVLVQAAARRWRARRLVLCRVASAVRLQAFWRCVSSRALAGQGSMQVRPRLYAPTDAVCINACRSVHRPELKVRADVNCTDLNRTGNCTDLNRTGGALGSEHQTSVGCVSGLEQTSVNLSPTRGLTNTKRVDK